MNILREEICERCITKGVGNKRALNEFIQKWIVRTEVKNHLKIENSHNIIKMID